jgi:hypothetical protein
MAYHWNSFMTDSCGVTTTNAVYCCGDNTDDGLVDGTTISRTSPLAVRWPVTSVRSPLPAANAQGRRCAAQSGGRASGCGLPAGASGS